MGLTNVEIMVPSCATLAKAATTIGAARRKTGYEARHETALRVV
jgi:hypothetical protein